MLDMLVKSQISREEFFELIKDRPTVCGIDASKKIDLSSETFVFNLPDDKIGIYAYGFLPSESLSRHEKTDGLPYEAYAKKGYLEIIPGTYIDQEPLKQYVCDFERNNSSEIKGISADPAWCHQLLIDFEEGRTPSGNAYEVFECPQTTAVLNEACELFQNKLLDGKLVICENELFIKHCSNAYKEYDKGGRMKVAKKNKDSVYRIDLLASTLDAIRKMDLLNGENLVNSIINGTFTF